MIDFKQLRKAFFNAGLTDQELSLCIPETQKHNTHMLNWLLPVLIFVLIGLIFVSVIPGSGEEPNKNLYLIFMLVLLGEYLIFKYGFYNRPEKVIIMAYIFMITTYIFGIYEATCLGVDASGTAICVFMVGVPLLVYDLPIRLTAMTLLVEVSLLVTYFVVNNQLGDRFIVINSLLCTILGVSFTCGMQVTKYSDIRNRLMLERQRDTDLMTGAGSRTAYFSDMYDLTETGAMAGIVYADVNGLKRANDTLGHEAGDILIKEAYTLMNQYFNGALDKIYRIGGDEFVIISKGDDRNLFEKRYLAMLRNNEERRVISSGCAWINKNTDPETACKEAEKKMYCDKSRFYTTHPDQDRRKRVCREA